MQILVLAKVRMIAAAILEDILIDRRRQALGARIVARRRIALLALIAQLHTISHAAHRGGNRETYNSGIDLN